MNEAETLDEALKEMLRGLGDFIEQANHQLESADRTTTFTPQPASNGAPVTESGLPSTDPRERSEPAAREPSANDVRTSTGSKDRATVRDLQEMYTQLQQSAIEAVLPQQRGRIDRRPIAPAAAGGDERLSALVQSLLKVNQEMLVELRKVADRSPASVFA